ncbi:NPC intracellular cholesterol transporter 2 [Nilaparvata lugens]|uniref:NPC intracellular cholesterol transporter 2 n=1 Tax=Nilaparvata lugens TaxID=108931 RepID=UPI000B98AADF|nr:NPC intracellular cholesterol transporter 2 [Nilaparvata lugens]
MDVLHSVCMCKVPLASLLLVAVLLQLDVVTQVNGATNVRSCPRERKVQEGSVNISSCEKMPCKLKHGSQVNIEWKFTPEEDATSVSNNIFAYVANIPLPWIGQDGLKVCNKIYNEDGVTLANCPLTAGKEYLYKNSFDILRIYPTIPVKVHWALLDQKRKALTCFEIDARITVG